MSVRKKGRCRFEHSGNTYVWWVDDRYIRIASDDKRFVVAYLIYDVPPDCSGILAILGPEFPGVDGSVRRPLFIETPASISDCFEKSVGAAVDALLTWSLDKQHDIKQYFPTDDSFSAYA